MRAFTFIILPLLGLRALLADPIYSIANLGGLGGGTSLAFRINNSGEAVGWAQTAAGDTHPFRAFQGSQLQDLAGPGVADGFAFDVNDRGQIAGSSYLIGNPHGLVSGPGLTADLGPDTFALAINNNGQVAGGNGHAILYANGAAQDLGTLSEGSWSAAYDINDSGAVAGTADIGNGAFRGFVWTATTGMTPIGTFGGNSSYATAISDLDAAAGFAALASGYQHAFEYSNGTQTDLGTLGGGSSFAYDVNNAGAVVGYSWLADGPDSHAFLYSNGIMVDLNSLLPANSGWELLGAYGINEAGQIVGEGLYQGRHQAFRLDPAPVQNFSFASFSTVQSASIAADVPEPGTWILMLSGALLIAVRYAGAAGRS